MTTQYGKVTNSEMEVTLYGMTIGDIVTFSEYPAYEVFRNDHYNWIVTVNRCTHWFDSYKSAVKFILDNA